MATVAYAQADIGLDSNVVNSRVMAWTPLTTTNTDGQPLRLPGFRDRSVQVEGTPGAGFQLVIQGRLEGSGSTNWRTLNDPSGVPLSFTAVGSIRQIAENVLDIRPLVVTGDGTTSVTVTMILSGG